MAYLVENVNVIRLTNPDFFNFFMKLEEDFGKTGRYKGTVSSCFSCSNKEKMLY